MYAMWLTLHSYAPFSLGENTSAILECMGVNGKPCSCAQFIKKSRIYYMSCENPTSHAESVSGTSHVRTSEREAIPEKTSLVAIGIVTRAAHS